MLTSSLWDHCSDREGSGNSETFTGSGKLAGSRRIMLWLQRFWSWMAVLIRGPTGSHDEKACSWSSKSVTPQSSGAGSPVLTKSKASRSRAPISTTSASISELSKSGKSGASNTDDVCSGSGSSLSAWLRPGDTSIIRNQNQHLSRCSAWPQIIIM